jgi:FemAB-related protein (PEP-CTERM system-associated)
MSIAVAPPLHRTSLPICVEPLTTGEERLWDDFVLAHPHASPFHLTAWKRTIEESFPYKPLYLMARDQSETIRAVLPLFAVRNLFIGRALISTPFGVYGGILADSDDARLALHNHVHALAVRMNYDYIEYRNRWPEQCTGALRISRYVGFSQCLTSDESELISSLPKKTRNMVRKALKSPFEMRSGIRDPRRFDDIHSRNMRRLGTPSFPVRYFERLLANFGSMADIREVWLNGTLTAAALNIYFRSDMHTYHAAADTRYNALGPNTFLYYDQIRWAGQNGFKTFDFGRCKRNTGVFEFKKHWSTTMLELPYEIVLINRNELPNFTPQNPKFDLPIRIWRKLPLAVTRAVSRHVFPLFP